MTSQLLGLKQAIPYLRKYRGSQFVIKVGGSIFQKDSWLTELLDQVAALYYMGIKIVLVHGGGPQLDALAGRMGIEQEKIGGRRITNEATLELAKMTYAGTLNMKLVSLFNALDVPAVGLTGADGLSVLATKRAPVNIKNEVTNESHTIDFGYVGDVVSIHTHLLDDLLSKGFIPVISSLASDVNGQILNINADTVSQHLAVALGAKKYINVTNVAGILKNPKDERSLLSCADIENIESMKSDGIIQGGMLPKVEACILAIKGGIDRAHIIDGREADSLLKEVFTNEGSGTLVVKKMRAHAS